MKQPGTADPASIFLLHLEVALLRCVSKSKLWQTDPFLRLDKACSLAEVPKGMLQG